MYGEVYIKLLKEQKIDFDKRLQQLKSLKKENSLVATASLVA